MAATFNGDTRLITLEAPTAGVLNQTVEQVYDDAKQWYLGGENSRFPFPFLKADGTSGSSGGEDITDTTIAGQYYFLDNNVWQIWTTDEDQDVFWEGNLIPANLNKRMIATRPGRTVAHFGLQPLVTGITGLSTIDSNVSAILSNVDEIWKLLGLDPTDEISITPSGITTQLGSFVISFTGDGIALTRMTRQP